MDVHAPHQPVHTWRDFFTHIVIITIGLFIALMMEAGVEWMHHRHLLHQAESNLSAEFDANRSLLAKDERQMQPAELDAMIAGGQQALVDLKLLFDLCHSLDTIYKNVDGKL